VVALEVVARDPQLVQKLQVVHVVGVLVVSVSVLVIEVRLQDLPDLLVIAVVKHLFEDLREGPALAASTVDPAEAFFLGQLVGMCAFDERMVLGAVQRKFYRVAHFVRDREGEFVLQVGNDVHGKVLS